MAKPSHGSEIVMSFLSRLHVLAAIVAMASGLAGVVAAEAAAIVERPAPTRPAIAQRPGYDFVQTLNALVAAQLATQNRPDPSNPYRVPRPRPDREQLLNQDKAGG